MQYGFTQFAIELNEVTDDLKGFLPRTDSRLRPDQRLLENGDAAGAEAEKIRLEEKQRAARKALEEKNNGADWTPTWFTMGKGEWVYSGGYWEAREKHFAGRVLPDIY